MPKILTDYRQMLEILTDNRHWDPPIQTLNQAWSPQVNRG